MTNSLPFFSKLLLAIRAKTAKRNFLVFNPIPTGKPRDLDFSDHFAVHILDFAAHPADKMMMWIIVRIEADLATFVDLPHQAGIP